MDHSGYENQACRDVDELPEIMRMFKPDIVFWIYPDYYAVRDILQPYRQDDANVKVISLDDTHGRLVINPYEYCDRLCDRFPISLDDIQKIITEVLGEQ